MTVTEKSDPAPDDRPRIEALVAACIEALEQGEADPASRVCGDRPDLLLRVRRRLAQLASRGLIPGSDALPSTIGQYRIQRELGSGGMGHVYLAEQQAPVRRQVAVKVIKLGMDTREVVARFGAERQALAQMSHPHIAQVFDAGITNEGRPFFAMEYVSGTMLTAFCDQRALPTVSRVRLMATVCRAVQHAHDRGFIHRDLKPTNVLVAEHDGAFVPKVIDFGVAKATATGEAAGEAATQFASMHTRADQLLGTPEYMSPEQLASAGLDIDTRTDVYSLGVTLYELLCGELPFDSQRLRRATRGELERIVRDELPTGPSRRLAKAAGDVIAMRGGQRTTVQRTVAGELDWITLKALAKNRDHRYPSAMALAEDLERWIRHEPVHAAPPGLTYRLRKFLRRHRVAVGAATIVLLSLIAGLVISLQAAHEARAALAREAQALGEARSFYGLARDAVRNLVDVADERLAEVPRADDARRRMLADAITFYEQLRTLDPRDPALRADMLEANVRVGSLQRRLGQTTDALATLQRCVAELRTMRGERPDDARLCTLAAAANEQLAVTATTLGRGDEAKQALQSALAHIAAARVLPAADLRAVDAAEARVLANLAIETDGDPSEALALYERSLAIWTRLDGSAGRHEHLRCLARYAECLTRAGRVDDAAAELGRAIERLQPLPGDAGAADREREAKLHAQFAAVLRRLRRFDEARSSQQRAIAAYAQLAREHPGVPSHADDEAAGLHFLAQLEEDAARPHDALATIARAVEIRERLAAAFPQDHALATRCVRTLLTKAGFEVALWQRHGGDKAPAEATIARAIEIADALHAAHGDDDVEVLIAFAAARSTRGAMLTTERRFGEAREVHVAVRDALDAKLDRFGATADFRYQLALTANNLVQAGYLLQRFAEARADGEQGVVHLEAGLAADARHRGLLDLVPTLIGRLATACEGAGDEAAAVRWLLHMCEHTQWGADAKEQACLLLGSLFDRLEENAEDEWRDRAIAELRSAIAARGDLAAALQRPVQYVGFSHTGSRLRDLDLRMSLAELLGVRDEREEQQQWLDSALQVFDTLPELRDMRARNLFAQRGEVALRAGRVADGVAAADALIARVGEDGGANYIAAVLCAQAHARMDDGEAKEAVAKKAVACLRRSIANREVPPDAASSTSFTSLRGRPDYEELLEK